MPTTHYDVLPCPGAGCFLCREMHSRRTIQWRIHPASPLAHKERVRTLMSIPVVRAICAAAPDVLDVRWLEALPPARPAFKGLDKVRQLLWDVCLALSKVESSGVEHVHCQLTSLVLLLWDYGVISLQTRYRLRIQVHELINHDMVTPTVVRLLGVANPKRSDLRQVGVGFPVFLWRPHHPARRCCSTSPAPRPRRSAWSAACSGC